MARSLFSTESSPSRQTEGTPRRLKDFPGLQQDVLPVSNEQNIFEAAVVEIKSSQMGLAHTRSCNNRCSFDSSLLPASLIKASC